MKIYEACRAGETEECKRVRYTETGSFSGGIAGGMAGGGVGKLAIKAVCGFGPWGRATCGIAVIGASSLGVGKLGEFLGEGAGELLYEVVYD